MQGLRQGGEALTGVRDQHHVISTSDTDTSAVSFILFSTRSASQKIGQTQTCAQVIVVVEKSDHSVKIKVEQYSQHTALLDTKLNVSTILNQSSIYGRGLAYIYQTSLPGTFLNRRHYHDVYLGMPLAQNGYMAYLMYQRALAKLVKLQQTGIQDHGQAYFKVQSATMLPNATWSLRERKASQSLLPRFHLFISFLFLPRNFCALIVLDTRYRSQSYTRTQGGIQTSKISALVASQLVQHSGEREVCFPMPPFCYGTMYICVQSREARGILQHSGTVFYVVHTQHLVAKLRIAS